MSNSEPEPVSVSEELKGKQAKPFGGVNAAKLAWDKCKSELESGEFTRLCRKQMEHTNCNSLSHADGLEACDRIDRLKAENKDLMQDLIEYGRHSEGCSGRFEPDYSCKCGWQKRKAELEQALKGVTDGEDGL